ncbi:hypothetical protein [Clostridium beijerinckii]|uniref:Uncharacterized protein n=1 Tax=Clostridium beijerinckii TaxID=1520 RepID=A0A1S8RCL2_CLOBE|nr:hypothetical protein [Clostridium beijerinckii]NRY60658.1 glucan phosphoethanolaminetransferase (alkaline phosphatase superfamily) [Clostridium beijerinckii]OOM50960.1 hypothetical protein CLBCK_51150 [Clostridium beijerinckii]
MRRNILLFSTKFLCTLFIICTIIMLFIAYKDIDNNIATKFGMCYFYLTLFIVIYMLFSTILNLRKLGWIELKERILRFIFIFILFFSVKCGFDYIIRHLEIDLLDELKSALSIAFIFIFSDIMFLEKRKN